MVIKLNGERYETGAENVSALLEELGITVGRVAVEVNLNIVKRCDYAEAPIGEGDSVEIVNFVGGG